MRKVERNEVLGLGGYEEIREPFRRRIIEMKRRRRVSLGPNMTALFENRDTALYQIQEMLRTERITREDAILHEIETYNELVPGSGELSVTVFVEYDDAGERERMLAALAGLEDKFYLAIGAERVAVRNETRGVLPGRTTAVHYTKYVLPRRLAEDVRSGVTKVVLGVAHPAYRAHVELTAESVKEIAFDLEPA